MKRIRDVHRFRPENAPGSVRSIRNAMLEAFPDFDLARHVAAALRGRKRTHAVERQIQLFRSKHHIRFDHHQLLIEIRSQEPVPDQMSKLVDRRVHVIAHDEYLMVLDGKLTSRRHRVIDDLFLFGRHVDSAPRKRIDEDVNAIDHMCDRFNGFPEKVPRVQQSIHRNHLILP